MNIKNKPYSIRAALSSDSLEAWVWCNDVAVETRVFIIIENPKTGKSIKVFKRTIDSNFVNMYNGPNRISISENSDPPILVISEYYRNLLGITQNTICELNVKYPGIADKMVLLHWDHPNPVIQYANRSTITSCIITLIALIITVFTLF